MLAGEAGNISFISASSVTEASAGSIDIRANTVLGQNGSTISVTGVDSGNTGNLAVTVAQIQLDQDANLQANVAAGNQGNIALNTDFLLLQNASNLTGTATGGNITIDTLNLVALDNSDITANATQGQGGNINITTQEVFLSPNSDITASSALGVDGVVTINRPETNETSVLQLPEDPIDASHQIAKACEVNPKNSFILVGRGGLPTDPRHPLQAHLIWQDQRTGTADQARLSSPSVTRNEDTTTVPLAEAQGWSRDDQGQLQLVAQSSLGDSQDTTTCLGKRSPQAGRS